MNSYTFDQIPVGLTAQFTRTVTLEMENAFREITGDDHILHSDDDFAREVGEGKFERHITYGMLTASLYSTMEGVYLPGKYGLMHSIDIKLQKPVYPGDTLTVSGKVTAKQEALKLLLVKCKITNQNGQCVSKADMKVLVLK